MDPTTSPDDRRREGRCAIMLGRPWEECLAGRTSLCPLATNVAGGSRGLNTDERHSRPALAPLDCVARAVLSS